MNDRYAKAAKDLTAAQDAGMPVITVRRPCDCPGRWFMCRCDSYIAHYQCFRTAPLGKPHADDIEMVRDLHPGMTLVY